MAQFAPDPLFVEVNRVTRTQEVVQPLTGTARFHDRPADRLGELRSQRIFPSLLSTALNSSTFGCALVTCLTFVTPAVYGADSRADSGREQRRDAEGKRAGKVEIANILGLSFAYQAPLSLDKDLPLGGGLVYTREYFVSRRTALGIVAAVRFFPDEPFHFAMGYGLSFKHYVGVGETVGERSGMYLRYGLLMQMNVLDDRSGAPTGHDTHMAIGYDWKGAGFFPVVELGYHVTQVRAFERDTLWWSYTEALVGLRF